MYPNTKGRGKMKLFGIDEANIPDDSYQENFGDFQTEHLIQGVDFKISFKSDIISNSCQHLYRYAQCKT